MIHDQPPPLASSGDVWSLVMADMADRRNVGIERYGTPLQPNNGRDALVDAYQEALDLVAYVRQEIENRTINQQVVGVLFDVYQDAIKIVRVLRQEIESRRIASATTRDEGGK
jgi:hypothetical protein